MTIAIYQGSFPAGAIRRNAEKIVEISEQACVMGATVIVFPELALSGYPPQDMLFQPRFHEAIEQALLFLAESLPSDLLVMIGAPMKQGGAFYNALLVFAEGCIQYEYHKQALPNYGVFDERRYFTAGSQPGLFSWKGQHFGFLICEDLWENEPLEHLKAAAQQPLDCVISIHASPFEKGKREHRLELAKRAVQRLASPLLYVQPVGVEDELIYDGGSFYIDPSHPIAMLPQFETVLALAPTAGRLEKPWDIGYALSPIAETYKALCYALKGYVDHYGFPGVLLGLSGGIDSALTLVIAVDALGPDRVAVVMMPSRYNAAMSLEDARSQATLLHVKQDVISIETLFQTFLKEVSPYFSNPIPDVTEENIQARLRGMILMALSNKSGKMVVTTTNKSELAVGYGTLYGDMAGGFALLKDVYKTEVYDLARYRNTLSPVIPERVMTRAPSAELRENQMDQDALPDYAVLDRIIQYHLGTFSGPINAPQDEISRVIRLIDRNEYKRIQAPLGPKITARAFGRDWRMPVMGAGS